MTTSKFNEQNASKLAAGIIGQMAMGNAHTYIWYVVEGVHFYITIEDFGKTGKKRYFINAKHEEYPREEGKDIISDKTYQNACTFFNNVNVNLAKNLF